MVQVPQARQRAPQDHRGGPQSARHVKVQRAHADAEPAQRGALAIVEPFQPGFLARQHATTFHQTQQQRAQRRSRGRIAPGFGNLAQGLQRLLAMARQPFAQRGFHALPDRGTSRSSAASIRMRGSSSVRPFPAAPP
jgi:hypothetical protein